jgi:hypothetical protein
MPMPVSGSTARAAACSTAALVTTPRVQGRCPACCSLSSVLNELVPKQCGRLRRPASCALCNVQAVAVAATQHTRSRQHACSLLCRKQCDCSLPCSAQLDAAELRRCSPLGQPGSGVRSSTRDSSVMGCSTSGRPHHMPPLPASYNRRAVLAKARGCWSPVPLSVRADSRGADTKFRLRFQEDCCLSVHVHSAAAYLGACRLSMVEVTLGAA